MLCARYWLLYASTRKVESISEGDTPLNKCEKNQSIVSAIIKAKRRAGWAEGRWACGAPHPEGEPGGFGVAPAPAEEAGPEESAHPGLQALVGLLPQQHLQAGGESSERSESPPGPRPRSTSSPVESAVELGP